MKNEEVDFGKIEKKWQKKWEDAGIFEVKEDSKKEKFYVLEQFPYPSGSGLHMGHAFIYTIGDVYARFKRMQGYNVLYPMGFDSFGLPAENAAIKEKSHPKKFTENAIKNFIKHFKSFGNSYNWSRMVECHKPDYYKWDQWIFLKMYEKGLAYRKEAPVNWCSKCNTVLANEQVVNGKCWRHEDNDVEVKQLEQWFLKTTAYADELYEGLKKLDWPELIKNMQRNWIGKSEGSEVDFVVKDIEGKEFVFFHAFQDNSQSVFWSELKKEIESRDGKVLFAQDLPNTKNPTLEEQLNFVKKNCKFKENTILVTHSLGSVLAMKLLPELNKKIRKLIMIAPPLRPEFKDKQKRPILEKYCDWKFDYNSIKDKVEEIVVLNCLNDHIVPITHARELAEKLNAKLIEAKGIETHFNGKKEPEIEKLILKKWPVFTTRVDTLFGVTFLVVSAQHPELMSLVTEDKKKEVQKFLKKIKSTKKEDSDKMEKEGVFTGSYAEHPLTGEKIPIWTGNFVVADYGSGMVMAVPAHDQRDFEFAKKYGLPVKPVILKSHEESFSYVMGVSEKEIRSIGAKIIEKTKDGFFKIKIPFNKIDAYKEFIKKNMQQGFWNEFSTPNGFYFIFKHKNGKTEELELNKKTNDIIDEYGMTFNGEKPKKSAENVYSWLAKNSFYKELLIHTDFGVLINSEGFDGLKSAEAKEHITNALEMKKLGRKVVNFRLRDWLISRQRFWGTPIPMIYCGKCGIVPVPEKELPVKLPDNIQFTSTKNPLIDYKPFAETKCPKCSGKARRETDTMDTFANSSWYFLRYTDSKNEKEIFDKKKAEYWMPIDMYIGGKEHAVSHDIYFRFYTKFLRDLGLLKFDEPAKNLFNQGFVYGSDGRKMSKSYGNAVLPEVAAKKYGVDAVRMFLMSVASPDKDFNWNDEGVESTNKFLRRTYNKILSVKDGKTSPKMAHKLNKTIKEVSEFISDIKYNFAVIKIRRLCENLEDEMSDKDVLSIVKIIAPFCPHLAEELWEKLEGRGFVSLEQWSKVDEGKIDDKFEKEEEIFEKIVSDINNILKLVKGEKVYIYALPNEVELYNEKFISVRTGKEVKVFAVNDKSKYDPEAKAGKAKPGKPAIYLE